MKKKGLKKGLKIGLAMLILFAVYNALWLGNLYFTYHPFTKAVPRHESGMYVYYDPGMNYSYNVKLPDYLSFTGNVGVSDNNGSGLIVWPGFFGQKRRYGVLVYDGTQTYRIYVDENMKPVAPDEELSKVYREHEDEILKLWEAAQSKWKELL